MKKLGLKLNIYINQLLIIKLWFPCIKNLVFDISSSIPTTKDFKNKRQRKRKIIWFNPPFNKQVTTNVAKLFLRLVDKHFPKFHKIFNRNTIQVSYFCMENVSQIIKSHNKNITSPNVEEKSLCNCRNKSTCQLDGKCQSESVVYKCVVTRPNNDKVYLGLTEDVWKKRYYNHTKSFRNQKYKNNTVLSIYI